MYNAKETEDRMLSVIWFRMNVGLVSEEYECPICKNRMKFTVRSSSCDGFEWLCHMKNAPPHHVCRHVKNGSWFEGSQSSI